MRIRDIYSTFCILILSRPQSRMKTQQKNKLAQTFSLQYRYKEASFNYDAITEFVTDFAELCTHKFEFAMQDWSTIQNTAKGVILIPDTGGWVKKPAMKMINRLHNTQPIKY
jgi:hypothetical protein